MLFLPIETNLYALNNFTYKIKKYEKPTIFSDNALRGCAG